MAIKQVDLDELRCDFLAWQHSAAFVANQNSELKAQLAAVERQLLVSQSAEREANETASQLREQVEKVQLILLKRCDMEAENRRLKEQIVRLKEEGEALEAQHHQQIQEALDNLDTAQAAHLEEVKVIKDEAGRELKIEVHQLKKSIVEQKAECCQLKKELENYDKDHHTQLVKIRLEYDAKLLKMQKETSKATSNHLSSVGHEIFRKKLQAARAESDREIMSLKRTISDLEKRLAGPPYKKAKSLAFGTSHR